MNTTTTCTLTLVNEQEATYTDDDAYDGRTVRGAVLGRGMARQVVSLLHRWARTTVDCRREELKLLGTALYEIAFSNEPMPGSEDSVRSAFERTLERCKKQERKVRLRIVLAEEATILQSYPWEFLYLDKGSGTFLAGQDSNLTLTRFVPNDERYDEHPEDGPLRILVVTSTPTDPAMANLNVEEVTRFADDLVRLGESEARSKRDLNRGPEFTVYTMAVKPGEPAELPTTYAVERRILEVRPHVIHFIGHGRNGNLAFSKTRDEIEALRAEAAALPGAEYSAQPINEAEWIESPTATDVLKAGLDRAGAPHRLVFLHACESASADENDGIVSSFTDVARLLSSGDRITGVIAMQYTIGIKEAHVFATTFYQAISHGENLDEAVRAARTECAKTAQWGQAQWWNSRGFGTPVSYLRRDGALVSRPQIDTVPAGTMAATPSGIPQGAEVSYGIKTHLPQPGRTQATPQVLQEHRVTGMATGDADSTHPDAQPNAGDGFRRPEQVSGSTSTLDGRRAEPGEANRPPDTPRRPQPPSSDEEVW